jgi:hypothetical protein
MILMAAINPNSTRSLLFVMVNAAKPAAVAALVNKFATPIRWITRESDFAWL